MARSTTAEIAKICRMYTHPIYQQNCKNVSIQYYSPAAINNASLVCITPFITAIRFQPSAH